MDEPEKRTDQESIIIIVPDWVRDSGYRWVRGMFVDTTDPSNPVIDWQGTNGLEDILTDTWHPITPPEWWSVMQEKSS